MSKSKGADRQPCPVLEEQPYYQTDDSFTYTFCQIFCCPYTVCMKIWKYIMSMCTGLNQLVIFILMIQWCLCKITRATTPDPIAFSYYFYMFGQIIFLTLLFVFLWYFVGKTIVFPFFNAFYSAFVDDFQTTNPKNASGSPTRLSLRKYCFRKGDLFDAPAENYTTTSGSQFHSITILTFVIEGFVNGIF